MFFIGAISYSLATRRTVSVFLDGGNERLVEIRGRETVAGVIQKAGFELEEGGKVNLNPGDVPEEGALIFVTSAEEAEKYAIPSIRAYNASRPQTDDVRFKITRGRENALAIANANATQSKYKNLVVTIDSLSNYTISGEITVSATAYCNCAICCGSNANGRTASGNYPQEYHTIAAPSSFAFGSKIYIAEFKDKPNGGVFTVEDRGGAIQDNRIDIFFNSHSDASAFGRHSYTAYILN
jgi:3D (Asp-Asp-Asp) domain-containing protein